MSKAFMCALLGHKIRFHFKWFEYENLYRTPPDTISVYCGRCRKMLIPAAYPLIVWLDYSEEGREDIRRRAEPYPR